jgi:hypothetical protein
MGGELVGDRDDIGVDAVNRTSEHNRRNLAADIGNVQIAIEFAALARADLDPFP